MRIRFVFSILALTLGAANAARAQTAKSTPTSPDSIIVAAERAIWELLKRQQ